MLHSLQIEALLLQHGFTLVDDNAHAVGYQHPALPERVYLKEGREFGSDPRKPVAKQPLVLHPQQVVGNLLAWLQAQYQTTLVYKNTNLQSFPKYPGSASRYGVAVAIHDAVHLQALLQALGGAASTHSVAGTTNKALRPVAVSDELSQPVGQTQAQALVAARRGQGVFRQRLDVYWGGCAVTGCQVRALLRASHIKPWAQASDVERLNPFNGLLLSAHLDAAFDQGLISFTNDGRLLIQTDALPLPQAAKLGIHPAMRLSKVSAEHGIFLQHHRAQHGFEA